MITELHSKVHINNGVCAVL